MCPVELWCISKVTAESFRLATPDIDHSKLFSGLIINLYTTFLNDQIREKNAETIDEEQSNLEKEVVQMRVYELNKRVSKLFPMGDMRLSRMESHQRRKDEKHVECAV